MIRILYLLPSLRSTGPILGTLALIRHLDQSQFRIVVACLDPIDEECDFIFGELQRLAIPVSPLNLPGWRALLRIGSLRRALEGGQFDIIHTYGVRCDFLSAVATLPAVRTTAVREMPTEAYRLNCGRLGAVVASRIHPWALRRMDCVIAISGAIKASLMTCGIREGAIVHVPNFVDLSCRRYARQTDSGRLGGEGGGVQVGYIGSLTPRKRVDRIIHAFAALMRRYPDHAMTLHFAGEGPLRGSLAELVETLHVENRVRFHGHVFGISDFISTLDFVVLASDMEGIPRALMEAMSMGKTCLGPRIAGVDELIEDGRTGYLFDPGSDSDLFAKMEQVVIGGQYLDPAVVSKHIESQFSAEIGAARTAEVYTRIATSRLTRTRRQSHLHQADGLPSGARTHSLEEGY